VALTGHPTAEGDPRTSRPTADGSAGKPATPGPDASAKAKAKAYGKSCPDQSKQHVDEEQGTAFSRCVTAAAKLRKRRQDSRSADQPAIGGDTTGDQRDQPGATGAEQLLRNAGQDPVQRPELLAAGRRRPARAVGGPPRPLRPRVIELHPQPRGARRSTVGPWRAVCLGHRRRTYGR
jgi:hypothetical protein